MTPQQLAIDVKEELADALADLGLTGRWSVLDVVPPTTLDPDSSLTITLASAAGTVVEVPLPSSLAIGYLADEEAAVDEWRLWIQEIATRLAS